MSKTQPEQSGHGQIVVLVKAAPHPSHQYRETVCTAGITYDREWVRLFPIAFRSLEEVQKFNRWDVIEYRWRQPRDDNRVESRRADQGSLVVVGNVSPNQRYGFLEPLIVDNLKTEHAAGRSLALVKPRNLTFQITKRSLAELDAVRTEFKRARDQGSLFDRELRPYEPCPYSFHYSYDLADGHHEGTCQDWEIEGTFFRWRHQYGEEGAIARMQQRWGTEFLEKEIIFAMGTHSRWRDRWLINGVIQMPSEKQPTLL